MYNDLCGPIGIESYSGEKLFIIFFYDYSRMMTVMYLREKSEAFEKFKWYLARVKRKQWKDWNAWDQTEVVNSSPMNSINFALKEESKDRY